MAIKNYAESWTNIYSNYLGKINFVAGDYTSLKEVMRKYIATYNPEQYNDWAESSEVGIFVSSIAYLGENINYRVDLNVHDLFPSTTRRKQSLLNFARLLSYASKRNTCAEGVAKVVSVSTTQDIYDSMGNLLQNVEINWNDANNANWLEQFLTIINASFSYNNQYGNPLKTIYNNSISTQLYQFNSPSDTDYTYPFNININSSLYQFEVINPIIDSLTNTISEISPKKENAFNILYRNDGAGNSSENTGFFVYWKQGVLKTQLYQFDSKVENNSIDVTDTNINNYDVWFEELSSDKSTVKTVWTKIADNEQLSYNNIINSIRSIYKVESMENDAIRLKFSDGVFGSIPYGLFRLCYRVSDGNDGLYIKPADIRNVTITIPYKNNSEAIDNNTYYLNLTFSVQNSSHIVQANATQSLASIREAAPSVYSTQNRMVSASDYNLYPAIVGQKLALLKAVNRTYSGNSRFVKFNDPTGTYAPVNVIADDGYLYGDCGINISDVAYSSDITVSESESLAKKFINKYIIANIDKYEISNIYYEYYDGYDILDSQLTWTTDFIEGNNSSRGHLVNSSGIPVKYESLSNVLKKNDMIYFEDTDGHGKWARIEVFEQGYWGDEPYYKHSSLSEKDYYKLQISEIYDLSKTWKTRLYSTTSKYSKYNSFDISLSEDEDLIDTMIGYMTKGDETSFCVTYDADDRKWICIDINGIDERITDTIRNKLKRNVVDIDKDEDFMEFDEHKMLNWFFKVIYNQEGGYWRFQSRTRTYVFGSESQTTFFFNTKRKNSLDDFVSDDYIKIVSDVNGLNEDYYWKPYNIIKYTDGYIDPRKFKVRAYDGDKDASFDVPTQFKEIVSDDTKIIFKNDTTTNEIEYLDFTDLSNEDDGEGYITVNNVDSTMWNHLGESGYYYLKHKCTLYKPGESFENIVAPKGTVKLTNGLVKTFSYEILSGEEDYVVVDSNIERVNTDEETSGMIEYKDNGEGYLYYYDADEFTITLIDDSEYSIKKGLNKLTFLWKHKSNSDYTVDPCPTNIIDMFVLTRQYYNDVQTWINNDKQDTFPKAPTAMELKSLFSSLETNKTISDTMVWHPVTYKLVFGAEADASDRCVFKVVKANDSVSDNSVKRQVISLIDNFFATMGVGESFYFTQLSTYIHTQIPNLIDSIVPVPTENNESFGKMFEIKCEDNEILLSSATLNDVQIISKMTANNLRISA